MSSPSNQLVEDGQIDEEQLERLLENDIRQAVMRHLLDEGEATLEDLIEVSRLSIASRRATDHDRVRAAIELRVDHIPKLAESGLITRDSDELVSMPFLPSDTIRRIRSILE